MKKICFSLSLPFERKRKHVLFFVNVLFHQLIIEGVENNKILLKYISQEEKEKLFQIITNCEKGFDLLFVSQITLMSTLTVCYLDLKLNLSYQLSASCLFCLSSFNDQHRKRRNKMLVSPKNTSLSNLFYHNMNRDYWENE